MRSKRTRQLPPFFTQVIGSLPRPKLVLDLIAARGQMDTNRYQGVMDEIVAFAIRLQEQAGLDVVSDGEWRRTHYIHEFFHRVGGMERIRPHMHQGEWKKAWVATHRMTETEPVFVKDAEFLVQHTDRCTKFALPSPFLVGIRMWHEDYSTQAYPTRQHLMEHLAELLKKEAQALVSAGIDIVQLDDPALTYFCDRNLMDADESHDQRLHQEWDINKQIPEAIGYINEIFEGLQAEVHLHCCHSVYKRQSDVTGNYEPVLPYLKDARIDCINLEFAYQSTGDISDLRLLPDHLNVGMGVVDVRTEPLQEVAAIEAIGAAGAELIGPDRIALNPDCGFAPDCGEPPTIDEAYEKLRRMCEAAHRLRRRFTTTAPIHRGSVP